MMTIDKEREMLETALEIAEEVQTDFFRNVLDKLCDAYPEENYRQVERMAFEAVNRIEHDLACELTLHNLYTNGAEQ